MTTVGDVLAQLDRRFPPSLAEEWDAIGLLTGRRADAVGRIALAVEASADIIAWAIAERANLLIVHHPLFLRGTTNVDGDSPKGSLVHDAVRAGLAVIVAHTNADTARPGVSDALADAIGVRGTRPVLAHSTDPTLGIGRVGELEAPCTLAEFAERVARALPTARGGVRRAGDAKRVVHRVAVCAGSGGDLLPIIDADVIVTSDIRHHPAADHLLAGRSAIIDIPHAAGESLWLAPLARELEEAFPGVTTVLDPVGCDPWSGVIGG